MSELRGRKADHIDAYVGRRLETIRRERGMSQLELGKGIGVSHQQIQKYEEGSSRVSASMLWRVCRVLEVNLADLFPRQDDPTPMPEMPAEAVRISRAIRHMTPELRRVAVSVVDSIASAQ